MDSSGDFPRLDGSAVDSQFGGEASAAVSIDQVLNAVVVGRFPDPPDEIPLVPVAVLGWCRSGHARQGKGTPLGSRR